MGGGVPEAGGGTGRGGLLVLVLPVRGGSITTSSYVLTGIPAA